MREKLEITANVVFIVVALLVGFLWLKSTLGVTSDDHDVVPRAGDQLPEPPGYAWSVHDQTLVLALKKGCQYCENSMPFYRKLVALKEANQTSVHLVALFPDAYEKARQVVDSEKLAIDVIAGVELRQFKVSGTPTLILVDRRGRVTKSWVGQLPEEEEAEVVRTLAYGSKTSQQWPYFPAAAVPPCREDAKPQANASCGGRAKGQGEFTVPELRR